MIITVTSRGPITTGSSVVSPMIGTFGRLMDKIGDDVDDAQHEYLAQIQDACFQAIRWCERDTYYFNETRDETFSTVAGQEWYGGEDNVNIPTLIKIHDMYCEHSGERAILRRTTPEEIERLSDGATSRGEPFAWTYFNRRLRLYPTPDVTGYTIRLQLGPYRLATITDQADSNVWTTEAFDMVKARAKYILYKDTLKDAVLAAEALNDYNDQHRALKDETSRRISTGAIQITSF